MSSASPFPTSLSTSPPRDESLLSRLASPLRWLGFWAAVVLPFVLLGLLVTGLVQQTPTLVAGVLAANVAGLVLGQGYNR